jgi:Acetyltransferase (GNAT) domain
VNKATRLGVHVRLAECDRDLNAWYRVYLATMRAKVVPARPYRFFESLWRNLSSNGTMQLLLAERYQNGDKKLLAGTVLLTFRDTMFYAFSGSCAEDLWLRPNDILQWTAIRNACRRGCRWYDLGEVPESHVNLADFKRKWGAQQRRLYRYYYPGDIDASGKSWNSDGLNHLARKVWPRLPLSLTAWLGEKIYHYL